MAFFKDLRYFSRPGSLEKGELSSEEESSRLIEEEEYRLRQPRRPYGRKTIWCLILALLFFSTTVSFFLGIAWQPNKNKQCMQHTSHYSSVMEEIDAGLHPVKFNGTLTHDSEYSGINGNPTPESDKAWSRWDPVKYASFSDEEFESMGMDMEGSAKFTAEYGGGYIGFLEVSHHMHCLNVIRQALHTDYYEKPENRHWAGWVDDRDFTIKIHISHCIEILRQNILCNGDVGVIPHHWVKDIPDPFANFNTMHKCRNVDSVHKWIQDHLVEDAPVGGSYPMPKGSKVWPTPP